MLGSLHKAQGDFAVALSMYQRAPEIRGEALGTNHPNVATILNKLALLYQTQGDFAKSLQFFNRSLSIFESNFGTDHRTTITALTNLKKLKEKLRK